MVGYLCAYLRYHYPLEFITALLNNAANDDDVANGAVLAGAYKIPILPPRWGHSKSDYFMDAEARTITKGVASVKSLNATVPNELYELAHSRPHWDTFTDVMLACAKETSLRSDQRAALIDIDFFAEFGPITLLNNIVDCLDFFKWGDAKSVAKTKAGIYEEFIRPHANDKTKAGKEAKSYAIIDLPAILYEYEAHQRTLDIRDLSLEQKASLQKERLGYVDLVTGQKADRGKLIITSKPIGLTSRKTGSVWCYRVDCKSLGSGKTARVSIRPGTFEQFPFKEGDFIEIGSGDMRQDKSGYWWITGYQYIF